MPRTCTICSHADKETINQDLVNGTPYRHIADRTGTSTTALQRHKNEHIPTSLAKAKEAEDVAQADDLLGQLVDLQAKALAILERAEEGDDLRTALMAVREARATMELVAKITGELVHKPEITVDQRPPITMVEIIKDYGPDAPNQGQRTVGGNVWDEIPA